MAVTNKHIVVIIYWMMHWALITDGVGARLIVEKKAGRHRFQAINEQTRTEAALEGRVDYLLVSREMPPWAARPSRASGMANYRNLEIKERETPSPP